VDEQRLKDSFARVAAHGDAVALFFYSHLFLDHPELRDMFPVGMAAQRDRLLGALGRIVSDVGNLDSLVPYLRDLGRDHRKFGATPDQYPAVGASLIAALAYFAGLEWTNELAADWAATYGLLSQVMMEAAATDEQCSPPWWDATIVGYERRAIDIGVLRVAPQRPFGYVPGQSVSVEFEERPRLWRMYSMANAPRPDGTFDLHVRIIDGGQVSPVLGRNPRLGARLKLGPPAGAFRLQAGSDRDIVMAAGGTGLAPVKAMLEQLADSTGARRSVHLVFGVRTIAELYDLPDLEKMAARSPWLTVTPAVSREPGPQLERGTIADVLSRRGTWRDHDAYVCGSAGMVSSVVST
jgi:NAD(P)H-flavin reductase/hemoglobin-like flavoprotein